jgi:predicted aconitase
MLHLTDADRAMLEGETGDAARLAMRVVVRLAEVMGANRLLDITGAHIDSCLYHGRSGLDFADRLADAGGRVVVPTTLNVSSLDLLHPELYRGDPETARLARRLMERYEEMGCRPTWTCAPYQLPVRPGFGEHVAWAESNAIVFANSVLGARTHRYGDFIDICAAITGRAPAAGLHLDENRRARVVIELAGVSAELLGLEVLYPVLGHVVGRLAGSRVPAIVGLPPSLTEDRLKALGAAAASSGAVGMVHAVGSTPEAPTLEAALGGAAPIETVAVTPADLRRARDDLTTAAGDRIGAVSFGAPHYSAAELERLVTLLNGRATHPAVAVYVNTGRDVLRDIERSGWLAELVDAGVQVVTDTCTYITPVMAKVNGAVMTDSAKWAYYAPGNIGVDVIFGSVEDCVESAVAGRALRDESVWTDA